jgi:hypothetical protein
MKKFLISVLPPLMILLLAVLAHAQNIPDNEPAREELQEPSHEKNRPNKNYVYIGLGVIGGQVSEDGGPDGTMDPGVHLLTGVNRGYFGLELNLGTPEDNGFFGFGFKFNILPYNEKRVTPWIGVDGYVLDIFTHKDRGCFAPALGFDTRLTEGVALRLGASKCSYTEDQYWPWAGQGVYKDMIFYNMDLILFWE